MTLISLGAIAKNSQPGTSEVCEIAGCDNAATHTAPYSGSVIHVCQSCKDAAED